MPDEQVPVPEGLSATELETVADIIGHEVVETEGAEYHGRVAVLSMAPAAPMAIPAEPPAAAPHLISWTVLDPAQKANLEASTRWIAEHGPRVQRMVESDERRAAAMEGMKEQSKRLADLLEKPQPQGRATDENVILMLLGSQAQAGVHGQAAMANATRTLAAFRFIYRNEE